MENMKNVSVEEDVIDMLIEDSIRYEELKEKLFEERLRQKKAFLRAIDGEDGIDDVIDRNARWAMSFALYEVIKGAGLKDEFAEWADGKEKDNGESLEENA